MNLLLTSAGLETEKITKHFKNMILGTEKNISKIKALFIPTAAIHPDAILVLPKCINDLLKCGIPKENITVFDLHTGMAIIELQQFDVVYICGGDATYLLKRINQTGFRTSLLEYINVNGIVIGVSAGSLIFSNNISENLGLIDTKLKVHCQTGESTGKVVYPIKEHIQLTNTCALIVRNPFDDMEIIGT